METKKENSHREETTAKEGNSWPLPDPYYSKFTTQQLKRRLERVKFCRQGRLNWPVQRNGEALRIHKRRDKNGRIEAWSEPYHVNRQKLRKYEGAEQRIERELARREAPSSHTSAGRPKWSENVGPRRTLVKSCRDFTARQMCELFDREGVSVTRGLKSAGFNSWLRAYEKGDPYRNRIDQLIHRDRRVR